MSDKKQFIAGLSWNTATVVIQILIQTVYTGVLARMIEADAFALMGIVLSIVGFAELFSQVGIGPAIIQKKELHPQHLSGAFYTATILGVLFTSIFIVSAPLIASIYNDDRLTSIIQVVSFSFVISAIGVVPRNLMLKKMDFKSFFKAGMISIIGGNLIIGLLLAYFDYGVWAYVWALTSQNLLMTLAYWWYERTPFPLSWKWQYTKELINYGGASTLFNALNYAATKVDVTLVPKYASTIPGISSNGDALFKAGIYERSAYVMSLPITIMAKLSDNVLFSGMAKLQDENEKLKVIMLRALHALSIIVIPACVLAIFTAPQLIRLYLGPQYEQGGEILRILFIAVIFRTLSRLADALLRARNAVLKGSAYKAFYLFIMIVGVYISIPHGLNVVAIAIAITTAIHFCMSVYLTRKLIKLSIIRQFRALKSGVWLGGLAALPLTLLTFTLQNGHPFVELLIHFMAWSLSLAVIVFTKPAWLNFEQSNPLFLIPKRFQSHWLIRSMLERTGL